ncbi:MAG: hypothetical protein JXR83_01145 [Deltaproteobacteria bacterium]|nr:hypothetical protein [Deltaproteobacteria bacterium]
MLGSFFAFVLAATQTPPGAEPTPPAIPLVCIGGITNEGLDDQLASALRQRLREELARLNALALPARRADIGREIGICADNATGVTDEATGVLIVAAMRFGPMVRLNLQFLDAANGNNLSETKLMLPVNDLLRSAKLQQALEAGVAELRKLPRARPAATTPEAAVSPPPPAPPIEATGSRPGPALPRTVTAIAPAPPPRTEPPPAVPPSAPVAKGAPLALIGWVSGGVGATLLAAGTSAGIAAWSISSQLVDGKRCARSQDGTSYYCFDSGDVQPDIDRYHVLSIVALVAAIGGGVALAGAGAALLLAPDEETASSAAMPTASSR